MIRTLTRLAVPLALLLASCGASGGDGLIAAIEQQSPTTVNDTPTLAEWASDNVSFVEEGGDLMQEIADAAGDYDTIALESACIDFGDWAQRGADRAPSPDPEVDRPWQAALNDAALAADTCIRGANGDVDALNRSSEHMSDFSDHITEATDAITD